MYDHLPGGEILEAGLRDLESGVRSVDSLLVLIAQPRLARHGIGVPARADRPALPEHELYRLLTLEHGAEAYRHYRSLLRRLVSLESALDSQKAPEAGMATGGTRNARREE
jgi:hypothetical protein